MNMREKKKEGKGLRMESKLGRDTEMLDRVRALPGANPDPKFKPS